MTLNPFKWLSRSYPPQPVTWETVFGTQTVLAGVSVSEYTALHSSPVWCGVQTLSRDIAKLPLVLYKNLPNGGKKRFHEHKLYRILHDEPNPEMTSFKFRETMQALCILYGNAYAEIVRDALGKPAGMYPILPSRVTPLRDERSGLLRYRVTNPSGGQSLLDPRNMIHLSALSTDGILGHSLTEHAGESIGLSLATEKFGAAFFGNGSTFGGVLEVPGDLKDPNVKDDLRKMVEAVHQGVERAHRILVLGNGAKFAQRGTAPNEAQMIETRKFQITEVARWLGMPNHKLGDLENAHLTNIEEQEMQYYVGCVSAWLKMWEQELSRKLISPLEYSQQTIEHVLEGVLRGDSTKRADYYGKMHSIGAFCINDILKLENMNPIGPEGDVHLVPLNMVPAERYREYFEEVLLAKPEPKQIAPPEDEEEDEDDPTEEMSRQLKEAIEQRDAALQAVKHHEARIVEAQNEIDAKVRERDDARATAAEHATAAAAQAERGNVAESERALALLEADTAKRALIEKEAALTESASKLAALEAERQAIKEAETRASTHAGELETRLQQRRDQELDRLTRVVSAHRTLIVHAVQRLLRPEVDRARRRQGTPEQLRKWMDAFYITHREVCADEFYPAVLTHLAWKRADDDPRVVARAMAEAHCSESERELRAVLDGTDDPQDLHVTLERVLSRWEQERPQAAADGLLRDELTYIRTFQ